MARRAFAVLSIGSIMPISWRAAIFSARIAIRFG